MSVNVVTRYASFLSVFDSNWSVSGLPADSRLAVVTRILWLLLVDIYQGGEASPKGDVILAKTHASFRAIVEQPSIDTNSGHVGGFDKDTEEKILSLGKAFLTEVVDNVLQFPKGMCHRNHSDFKENDSSVDVHSLEQNKIVSGSEHPALMTTQLGRDHPTAVPQVTSDYDDDTIQVIIERSGNKANEQGGDADYTKNGGMEDTKSKGGPCHNEAKAVEGERREAGVSGVDGIMNQTLRDGSHSQSLNGPGLDSGLPFSSPVILTSAAVMNASQLLDADTEAKSGPVTTQEPTSARVENGLDESTKDKESGRETTSSKRKKSSGKSKRKRKSSGPGPSNKANTSSAKSTESRTLKPSATSLQNTSSEEDISASTGKHVRILRL